MYLFLALVLLFLVLNTFCTFYLNWYYKRRFTPQYLKNIKYRDNLKKLLPGLTHDNIIDLLKIFSSKKTKFGRFRMTYAPFTEHRDREFHSPFLNVSSDGFRHTKKAFRHTLKSQNIQETL